MAYVTRSSSVVAIAEHVKQVIRMLVLTGCPSICQQSHPNVCFSAVYVNSQVMDCELLLWLNTFMWVLKAHCKNFNIIIYVLD